MASPPRRTREAAELLAKERNVDLRLDVDWAELDFGAWDGCSKAEIERNSHGQAALAAFYRDPSANLPPGGEPWTSFEARIARALGRLARHAGRESILVVTHAGPIRLALSQSCGLSFDGLWALRIGYGTRIRLHLQTGPNKQVWGEIVEISQP